MPALNPIKPSAVRIQPDMKARLEKLVEKGRYRSVHAATLDAVEFGLAVLEAKPLDPKD